jgi:hypothetical protein
MLCNRRSGPGYTPAMVGDGKHLSPSENADLDRRSVERDDPACEL